MSFADGRAFATCGDYLTVNEVSTALIPAGDLTPNGTSRQPTPPCQGPHCRSQHHAPSPAPSVPLAQTLSNHWIMAAPPAEVECRGITRRADSPELCRSLIFSDVPYRPPRGH